MDMESGPKIQENVNTEKKCEENEDHDRHDKGTYQKEGMDTNNSWWVSTLLAADCGSEQSAAV